MQTPTGRQQPPHSGNPGATLVGEVGAPAAAHPSHAGSGPAERAPESGLRRVILESGPAERGPGLPRVVLESGPAVRGPEPSLRPVVFEPGPEPAPAEPDAAAAGPVFVDASGRRRKLARRASLAVVAVLAGYAGLLAVSFAGGPIPPNALLPVPGIPSGKPQAPASSAPAKAAAAPSSNGNAVAGGRPTAGATDHRSGVSATTPGGAPGQSAPSEPAPTTPRTTASAPPLPTPTGTSAATTAASTHAKPTPPGRTRHESPSASQSS